ncbi:MAG: purine-binding chemotaxis protein CheW [SAR324 cluster bacterium]|nr:purine-binding chemotaxis protein CheW [SAR324 cluster bacterium]
MTEQTDIVGEASMKLENLPLSQKDLEQTAAEYRESSEHEDETIVSLLIFLMEDQYYACSVEDLQETLAIQELTPLPEMHPAVSGLINLRGSLLLTFDLRRFFGMTSASPPKNIVVVQSENHATGILVESIQGVDSIPLSSFQGSIETASGIPSAYIRGVRIYHGLPLLWLDINQVVKKLGEVLA